MSFLYTLSELRNPVLDKIMLLFGYAGTPYVILAVLFFFYYNVNKKTASGLFYAYALSDLVCQDIKVLARIPRPWILDPNFTCVEGSLSASTGYSFPSIHTQTMTCLCAGMTVSRPRKKAVILSVVLIGTMMFSRMYLGVHTPFDTITALVITLVMTIPIMLLWRKGDQDRLFMIFFVITNLTLIASLIIGVVLVTRNYVDTDNASDLFKMIGAGFGFLIGSTLERSRVNFSCKCSLSAKFLRILGGIAGILAIEFALKATGFSSLSFAAIRYALMLIWASFVWPLIFSGISFLKGDAE